MTKERPVLFSGAMVRAILDGRKTQTRRVMSERHRDHFIEASGNLALCPYGQRGDRLWVRETWGYNPDFPGMPSLACFRADPEHKYDGIKWKPSIHMPRAACRLMLEITGVRVERLNDCSEADATAEGVEPVETEREEHDFSICRWCGGTRLYTAISPRGGALPDTDCLHCDTHLKRYAQLWDDINGAGAWEANPWVWVVEFRKV